MKSNRKDFRKDLLKNKPLIFRLCIFLHISKLRITDRNIWKNNTDYNYEIMEYNLYNPLSYIALLFMIPLAILVDGIRDTFEDFNRLFKYR